MKKITRYLAAALSACLLLWSLTACGEAVAARDRLGTLLSLIGEVPAGGIYATLPQEGDTPLGEPLIEALYMRADGYLEYTDRIAEAAVYLGSSQEPFFEAAVFVCYGSADTRAVLEMCMRRARLVASVHTVKEGDVVVAASGRTVVYVITRDTAAAQKAIDRLF